MSKVIEDAAQDFAAINDDKAANSAYSYSKYDIADAYQQGADFGYSLAENRIKKEYEEKLRWIPVEEILPEFDNSKYPNGDFEKYEVKFCTGGISPKCFIQISHLIREDKFSGEFDWTRATHWRRIPFL